MARTYFPPAASREPHRATPSPLADALLRLPGDRCPVAAEPGRYYCYSVPSKGGRRRKWSRNLQWSTRSLRSRRGNRSIRNRMGKMSKRKRVVVEASGADRGSAKTVKGLARTDEGLTETGGKPYAEARCAGKRRTAAETGRTPRRKCGSSCRCAAPGRTPHLSPQRCHHYRHA